MKKEKNIIIRLDEVILKDFKIFCEENGYTMSKLIRGFIVNKLKKHEKEND